MYYHTSRQRLCLYPSNSYHVTFGGRAWRGETPLCKKEPMVERPEHAAGKYTCMPLTDGGVQLGD
jgi:hypothetical protein